MQDKGLKRLLDKLSNEVGKFDDKYKKILEHARQVYDIFVDRCQWYNDEKDNLSGDCLIGELSSFNGSISQASAYLTKATPPGDIALYANQIYRRIQEVHEGIIVSLNKPIANNNNSQTWKNYKLRYEQTMMLFPEVD